MSQFSETKQAVALKYNANKDRAPVIIASGSGYIADKIAEIAEETGVPVYRDASLSALLSQLSIGSEIPPELYSTIVDIYVYFLSFKIPKDDANDR
jgi:flagellar biosynthesis protein